MSGYHGYRNASFPKSVNAHAHRHGTHTCTHKTRTHTCAHTRMKMTAHATRTHVYTHAAPQALTEPPSRQRDVQDEDSVVRRLLFSAPWAVLRCYAEDLGLKLPLQVPRARGGREGLEAPHSQDRSW